MKSVKILHKKTIQKVQRKKRGSEFFNSTQKLSKENAKIIVLNKIKRMSVCKIKSTYFGLFLLIYS